MAEKITPNSYNPLYLALRDQISTENVIFKQKQDLYATALTLTATNCFKKGYIKDNTKDLIIAVKSLIKDTKSLTYFKESGIIFSLAKKHSVGGTKEIKEYLEECFKTVGKSNTPPQILGSVGYFLNEHKSSLDNYEFFQVALSDKVNGFISNNNLNAAIDSSIGIANFSDEQKEWLKKQASTKLKSLAVERISKLVILFNEDDYVKALEEALTESLGSVTYPDIGFSIFEAQKIINSNIPNTSLSNILTELKKVDASWSKMITNMESEGITIDVAQLHKVPTFSPHQDVWSLIGLESSGRAQTVQIATKEYKDFVNYLSKTDKSYRRVSVFSVATLLFIAVLQALYTYLLFDLKDTGFLDTLKNLSLQNSLLDVKSIYFIFVNPWLQLGVGLIWIPVLFWRLAAKGRLTLLDILLSWPVLLPFYEAGKWIKERASN